MKQPHKLASLAKNGTPLTCSGTLTQQSLIALIELTYISDHGLISANRLAHCLAFSSTDSCRARASREDSRIRSPPMYLTCCFLSYHIGESLSQTYEWIPT
ncbi:hypothetical protein Ancab_012483 [Ancistrocladus abbreviatus]